MIETGEVLMRGLPAFANGLPGPVEEETFRTGTGTVELLLRVVLVLEPAEDADGDAAGDDVATIAPDDDDGLGPAVPDDDVPIAAPDDDVPIAAPDDDDEVRTAVPDDDGAIAPDDDDDAAADDDELIRATPALELPTATLLLLEVLTATPALLLLTPVNAAQEVKVLVFDSMIPRPTAVGFVL